jgi:hypothetical protein
MRLITPIVLALSLLFPPAEAWARLRPLGVIETVGLTSENPLDVTIRLEGCEWDGVTSSDGGHTWRVIPQTSRPVQKTQPPKPLYPLPEEGPIRYRVVDEKRDFHRGRLFVSEDGGATWTDVSPWRFLSEEIVRDVDAEQQRFLFLYGSLLPNDKAWPWAFGATAAAFLGIGGRRCRNLRGQWRKPVIRSAIAYVLTGLALFLLHWLVIWDLCTDQWHTRYWYWSPSGVRYPLWPMGIFLHLTGNAKLAPLVAAALFPSTALCASILFAPANSWRPVYRTLMLLITYGGPVVLLMEAGKTIDHSNRIEEFESAPPDKHVTRAIP